LFSVVESVATASVAIVLWYASTRAELADPDVSAAYIGTVVAFYQYIQRFFIPIRDLSTKYTIIQQSLASAERIFTLMDTDEPDAPTRSSDSIGDAPRMDADVVVAFDHVTFAYREGHPVLHDVSFRVRRGETVAVVGATGSGKTTTTSLLLRLYDYDEGHVLVNGEDVRTLDRHDLRSRFAMVPQDVFLFAGTVLSNVTLGRDVDEERARQALERVGAWHLLEDRGGLEARIDERGQNFSAGERQLIAFARALYRDPQLLILDEATANIDSETESRLQKAVLQLVEGRTSLVIAHRLSTIRHADRILVFHHGRIAEQGTHDELLAAGGIYARLHRLSFETQVDEGGEMEHPSREGGTAP
jgi:ATP-binding cassette subfamily B protein